MSSGRVRSALRWIAPPLLVEGLRRARTWLVRDHEWTWHGEEWPDALRDEGPGWNEPTVVDAYERRWPSFLESVASGGPFRAAPDAEGSSSVDLEHHNATMVFAYSLLLSAQRRPKVRMLDWGGGMGHYLAIARAVAPGVEIEYTSRDLPLLVERGRRHFPEATFTAEDDCLANRYDFVLASASLHYSKDWRQTLGRLAVATDGFLLVTRAPMVTCAASFVFFQHPSDYRTSYPGWCLNRAEFLEVAESHELSLVREFELGYSPVIQGAPEQNIFRGFLFQSIDAGGPP